MLTAVDKNNQHPALNSTRSSRSHRWRPMQTFISAQIRRYPLASSLDAKVVGKQAAPTPTGVKATVNHV